MDSQIKPSGGATEDSRHEKVPTRISGIKFDSTAKLNTKPRIVIPFEVHIFAEPIVCFGVSGVQ